MKKLLLLFTIISATVFAQPPLTADSIYWSAKYCDTTQSVEDCTDSWLWHAGIGDCIQPSIEHCTAIWPDNGWITDSYECCCQVTSLPGSESSWTGFIGSPCETYLDSIGFIHNDPDYVNWTSLDENELKLNGIYIDTYGRMYTNQPSGLSILNRKKYFKIK